MIESLCVFCGSSLGAVPAYEESARTLGRAAAAARIRIIYGGASVGLMGALADAALDAGGEVIGVIPRTLVERELAHRGLARLHIVETMHERKAKMAELADAFVALPGGLGTLEELFEVWTWGMLGLHAKPYAVVNVDGYYAPLVAFLDRATDAGFVRPAQRAALLVENDASRVIDRFNAMTAIA